MNHLWHRTAPALPLPDHSWVEGLRSADLALSCDATGLTAGTYELPIICKVNSSDDVAFDVEVVPRTVQVEITKK